MFRIMTIVSNSKYKGGNIFYSGDSSLIIIYILSYPKGKSLFFYLCLLYGQILAAREGFELSVQNDP